MSRKRKKEEEKRRRKTGSARGRTLDFLHTLPLCHVKHIAKIDVDNILLKAFPYRTFASVPCIKLMEPYYKHEFFSYTFQKNDCCFDSA